MRNARKSQSSNSINDCILMQIIFIRLISINMLEMFHGLFSIFFFLLSFHSYYTLLFSNAECRHMKQRLLCTCFRTNFSLFTISSYPWISFHSWCAHLHLYEMENKKEYIFTILFIVCVVGFICVFVSFSVVTNLHNKHMTEFALAAVKIVVCKLCGYNIIFFLPFLYIGEEIMDSNVRVLLGFSGNDFSHFSRKENKMTAI